jgi:hypothetical protein
MVWRDISVVYFLNNEVWKVSVIYGDFYPGKDLYRKQPRKSTLLGGLITFSFLPMRR